jgi:hypothetical protein
LRTLTALLTALVVSVLGATALPAAALAGHGQANGHANKPEKASHTKSNNGKAHQADTTQQPSKAQGGGSAKSEQSAPANETHGKSAQAHSKSSHSAPASQPASQPTSKSAGKSGGTSAGTSGGKGDPRGNNGTIKLAGFDAPNGPGHSSGDGSTPMHPSNDPHLPCTFSVEGYGFDAVASHSALTFDQHAPTSGGSSQHGTLPLDQDSHSGGGSTAGYDGVQDFNLTFVGAPHPKHGYHVKLTAVTEYSQGSNVKHKVFWVEPCETSTPPGGETPGGETPGGETPGGETPGGETPGGETPGGETPGGETPGGETPGGETPGGNTPGGAQETVDQNGGNSSTVVLGAQASVKNSQGAQAAAPSAGAQAAQVPTAIESGLTGEEWSRSVLPLLLVMLGLGTTFVALVRRRTRVQSVRND